MANIPVERTDAGTPWWLWLLGLLLLAGLIWFLVDALGDDDDVDALAADDDIEAVAPAAALDLSDVYVTRVVGDNTFFVAPTPGGSDETLVYLEEEPDPTDNVEGRYDVTAGQHISITGDMEPTPADLTPWGLTDAQASMVGDEYIRATSLTILDEAMAESMAGGLATLAALSDAFDAGDAAGMMTELDDVRVTALAGDSTFYIGDGAQRVLVVLESLGESEVGPGDGSDGVFDVNVGDEVDMSGTVRAFTRGMRGTATLAESDQAEAERRRFVVVVDDRGSFSKD